MLFNSYIFLFAFLPLAFAGFALLAGRDDRRPAKIWLIVCSLAFYGWFAVADVPVILTSIAGNYLLARAIAAARGEAGCVRRTKLFRLGVAANVALLAYFKYTRFFLTDVLSLFGLTVPSPMIVLPLGISFFTFQQIIFLRDIRSGAVTRFRFLDYVFCVTFFPHLIAGPIIKYKNILAQLGSRAFFGLSSVFAASGLAWLTLGLVKKVLIADLIAPFANEVFGQAAAGGPLGSAAAWAGVLAYTFQIYFDFSGYSDMAIGLALLFKIELPVNFDSPYKSRSIVEFWRRWHITLSWFLRECLYIPLGGNRHGALRQYANLLATMLLGGLWHGAGYGFILWGGAHGLALAVTHAVTRRAGPGGESGRTAHLAAVAATFALTALAWVLFRAETLPAAGRVYAALFGAGGGGGPAYGWTVWSALAGCAAVSFLAPNTQQIMAGVRPRIEAFLTPGEPPAPRFLQWRPTVAWAALLGALFFVVVTNLSNATDFLYFQF
ncbi:MBOAT family O-acyltransferase [Desulfovibrio sp. TomC]|uniref:MBOAT family O-acyltransferase n=1 Tax=Desulfovibrio sp. TomC TaxID=1562888 RepID=UPI00057373D6|nr:MBOAT family O-acyltransferase [Desulfovibrio sp. TomC]KHK01876.1 putative poly(beta-D-mannuronate) O-acetylase [Desulfovibrio sp. TomC]